MNAALRYAERIAYSSKEVLHFTYDQAVKYRDSSGVYVECGVAAGAQIIAMAAGAPDKTIYACDSFEGIPYPSCKDNQMPGIREFTEFEQSMLPDPGKAVLETTGATSVSVLDFRKHIWSSGIDAPDRIQVVAGWFENTMQIFSGYCPDIAILRLDGDLYNSTYVCLKYLYPKVIKGGLVIIDDWALPGCQQAVIDYFKEIGQKWLVPWIIEDKNSQVAYWTK